MSLAEERAAHAAEVTGRRVYLRLPVEGDRAEFLALLAQSRAFLAPWMPRWDEPNEVRQFEGLLAARADPSSRKWLVCRRQDGAILGGISLNNVVRGVLQSAAVGYWIGAPHARQGYMAEALSLALRHAFRTMRLHRVEANVIPSNARSKRLIRHAGFRREGLSRRYLKIAGRWQDHERWALLAEEGRPGPRGARRPLPPGRGA